MDLKKLDAKELEKVSGGTAEYEDTKREDFEIAWTRHGFDQKGLTGTELEDLFTQWQNAGYKPDAYTFLQNCKTI